MAHTPGPWTAEGDDNCLRVTPPNTQEPVICDLVARDADAFTDEDEANGRLIAAAPELLIACRAIRKSCPCDPDSTREFNAAWGILEAAIAKAEATS